MEPVFAGIFGFWLAGDPPRRARLERLLLIMAGIVVSEPERPSRLRNASWAGVRS